MENNRSPINTRSRSRSMTPMIFSNSDQQEAHGKTPLKINSSLNAIEEELNANTSNDNTRHKTTIIKTVTTRTIIEGANKSSYSSNVSQGDMNTNFSNSNIQTSTPIYTSKRVQRLSGRSGYTNGSVDLSKEHLPYKEYKEAGEFWNKFPKTDYAYSKFSPFRVELAPGIFRMPNMSRKSIYSECDPELHKYDATLSLRQRSNESTQSRDEVDTNNRYVTENMRNEYIYSSKSYRHVTESTITTKIVTLFTYLTSFLWSSNINQYRRTYNDNRRGLFGWISDTTKSTIYKLFSLLYLAASTVFLFDYWLLKTSTSTLSSSAKLSQVQNNKKWLRLILLLVLPLLLVTACWWWYSDSSNEMIEKFIAISNVSKNLINSSLNMFMIPICIVWDGLKVLWTSSLSSSNNYNKENIQNLIKTGGLTRDDYNQIINHINSYVDKLIESKLTNEREKTMETINLMQEKHNENFNKMSQDITVLIAKIVHENIASQLSSIINEYETKTQSKKLDEEDFKVKIIKKIDEKLKNSKEEIIHKHEHNLYHNTRLHQHHYHHYELNNNDIQKIVDAVYEQLKTRQDIHLNRFTLNSQNLEEIKKLINENIAENNKENLNIYEQFDFNEILMKILESKKLSDFIDTRIDESDTIKQTHNKYKEEFNLHKNDVNNLFNNEINLIKEKLNKYENDKKELQNLVDILKEQQNELKSNLNNNKNDLNMKLDKTVNDINAKISSLHESQLQLINKQIKNYLINIFDPKNTIDIEKINKDDVNLSEWIRNTFVAKEYLEDRLKQFQKDNDEKFQMEIERSKTFLLNTIIEKMRLEIIKIIDEKQFDTKFDISEKRIQRIVNNAIQLYDADKVGLVDYALESAGGQVLSTRCTENYHIKSAQLSLFGIPIWYPSNTPRIAITSAVQPGECWAFQGFPGFLVLKLNTMIYVTGFTVEHIPKSISPNGRIDSAPKLFTVLGLAEENDPNPYTFGEYEYYQNGTAWQYFPVKNTTNRPFDIIELRIESNHGNLKYTCLYRFRVHGTPLY